MTKLLFMPFSVVGGFLAGKLATFTFERIWRLVDDRQSPEPDQRAARWPKLIAALALEGAMIHGRFDRVSTLLTTVGAP